MVQFQVGRLTSVNLCSLTVLVRTNFDSECQPWCPAKHLGS
jgi:hypothetical protein